MRKLFISYCTICFLSTIADFITVLIHQWHLSWGNWSALCSCICNLFLTPVKNQYVWLYLNVDLIDFRVRQIHWSLVTAWGKLNPPPPQKSVIRLKMETERNNKSETGKPQSAFSNLCKRNSKMLSWPIVTMEKHKRVRPKVTNNRIFSNSSDYY